MRKFVLLLLLIFLISIFSFKYNNEFVKLELTEEISTLDIKASFSSPINITNYDDFLYEGFTGIGTLDNPFVLNSSNRIVSPFSSALTIYDSSYFFVIQNCTFSGYNAISIENSANGLIINNTLSNNFNSGVNIRNSTNIQVINNEMLYNNYYGLAIRYSSSISVQDNLIADNFEGLLLNDSTNNSIANNTFVNNERFGIMVLESKENTFHNNTFFNEGLMIQGNTLAHYQQDIINNTINGKKIIFLHSISSTTSYLSKVDNLNDIGQLIVINSSNFEITKKNILDGGVGIYLSFSNNISITHNTLTSNFIGIAIEYSFNITIASNNVNNNYYNSIKLYTIQTTIVYNNSCSDTLEGDSIYLYNGTQISILDNICNRNSRAGIAVFITEFLDINNNICKNNSDGGILLQFVSYTEVTDNICYNNNFNGGINIQYSDHLSIRNNYATFNTAGILLYMCFNIKIIDNYQENNYQAISIQNSDNATVIGNELIFNIGNGISLTNTSNSLFVNNSFFYNRNYGFSISGSSNNHFESNYFYNNSNFAFYLEVNEKLLLRSENNTIYNNLVFHSTYYTIYLDTEAVNNTIINNTFFSYKEILTSQGYDAGINNYFNNNYWSDCIQKIDENNDGIADEPYYLDGGSNADYNPSMTTNYEIPITSDNCSETSLNRENKEAPFIGIMILIAGLSTIIILKRYKQ